jgi:hypothetical protein
MHTITISELVPIAPVASRAALPDPTRILANLGNRRRGDTLAWRSMLLETALTGLDDVT